MDSNDKYMTPPEIDAEAEKVSNNLRPENSVENTTPVLIISGMERIEKSVLFFGK